MTAIASQITSLTIVYSTVYSGAHQRKHQSSASLAFVRGIHRGPVNSPHKWPATRKMFPFDDVIMITVNIMNSLNQFAVWYFLYCGKWRVNVLWNEILEQDSCSVSESIKEHRYRFDISLNIADITFYISCLALNLDIRLLRTIRVTS